jgi:hypothetical protein
VLDFYRTVGGRKFFDGTVPDLVQQVKRVADALERVAELLAEAKPDARANAKDVG